MTRYECLTIDIKLTIAGEDHTLKALIDSGAEDDFISQITGVTAGS